MSTPTLPIALTLGSGSRVGAAANATFLAASYRVARVSRSRDPSANTETLLNIPADLSDPASVERVFAHSMAHPTTPPRLRNPHSDLRHSTKPQHHFLVRRAPRSAGVFSIPFSSRRTQDILFTGNIFNQGPLPGFLALGTGKAGAAWMVEIADSLFATSKPPNNTDTDIRFHYLDERHDDGTPMFTGLGGQGHADAFLGLAERRERWRGLGWLVTFVSGDDGKNERTRAKEVWRGLILPEGL